MIVGAAKAGTTSLYDDLSLHPHAAMPSDKEPDILHKASTTAQAIMLWQRHFKEFKGTMIRAEASTFYTMLPDYPDVSSIAKSCMGADARIIYMMRHPIRRIESHLAHDFAVGRLSDSNYDKAALEDARYVNWSDYPRQIRPWVDAFGREAILPVIFEEYVQARYKIAREVAHFVGLDPRILPERSEVSNVRGSQRSYRSALFRGLAASQAYRTYLRGILPQFLRQSARLALTRRGEVAEVQLSPSTIAELKRRLAHINDGLHALGIEPGKW
jgi:hypothetical protein